MSIGFHPSAGGPAGGDFLWGPPNEQACFALEELDQAAQQGHREAFAVAASPPPELERYLSEQAAEPSPEELAGRIAAAVALGASAEAQRRAAASPGLLLGRGEAAQRLERAALAAGAALRILEGAAAHADRTPAPAAARLRLATARCRAFAAEAAVYRTASIARVRALPMAETLAARIAAEEAFAFAAEQARRCGGAAPSASLAEFLPDASVDADRLRLMQTLLLQPEDERRALDEAVQEALREARTEAPTHEAEMPLAAEKAYATAAKKSTLYALGLAREAFGDELPQQEEILLCLADMAALTYAVESAVMRAARHAAADDDDVAIAIAQVFSRDALVEIERPALAVVAASVDAEEMTRAEPPLLGFTRATAIDSLAALRRIGR